MTQNTREIEESTTESDILARNEKLVEFLAVCERQVVIQNMSFYNQSVVENAKDRGFFETESKTAPK